MDNYCKQINSLFVELYRGVLSLEEKSIKNSCASNITIGEMHILECIGRKREFPCRVSDIATDMDITLPSATIAVNKLVKKGFLTKIKDENDRRAVCIKLTRFGRRVNIEHRYFHEKTVISVISQLDEQEKQSLLSGLTKLTIFFKKC